MFKASATSADGRTVLILGLTEENVARLRTDQPIVFDIDGMKLPPEARLGNIVVFYGVDEAAMYRALRPLLGPDTVIHAIPRGNKTPQ